MFKHQDIINKLTLEQKLNLIADVGALGQTEGYAFTKEADLNDGEAWKMYPNFNQLANSWDVNLIKRVVNDLFAKLKNEGVNLATLPSVNVKVSPYSNGIAEDALLGGSLVGAIASQAKACGMATCLSDPQLEKQDIEQLDNKLNQRVVSENLLVAHQLVLQNGVKVVKLADKPVNAEYDVVNNQLVEQLKGKYSYIYDKTNKPEQEKHVDKSGNLYKGCSVTELKDAYDRYLKLKQAFDAGEIAISDINSTCESGWAISDEMIDTAVDKLLDFADECNSLSGNCVQDTTPQTVLSAMAESTVMLKNNQMTLPLRRRSKVAIVGALASNEQQAGVPTVIDYFSKGFAKEKINLIGYAQGYNNKNQRDASLINQAVALSLKADFIIVTLGYNKEQSAMARKNKNSRLPACQEELVKSLTATGKKVIVLLYGSCDFDMSFDKDCHAVLLVPDLNIFATQSLFNILIGKVSPGGRLKTTLYDNTDKHFARLKNYKNAHRNDVGMFFGYRHYDTGGYIAKYPFGFGLSYGRFIYSGFRVQNGLVSFKVKNCGRVTASEAVQVYVGKKNSAIIRPKKELKYFTKVTLQPGKTTKITFKVGDLDLSVYDLDSKGKVTESGVYEIYVGSSIKDIKFKGQFVVAGKTLKKDNLKYNAYFQNRTNIHDGKFYLEEPMQLPKRFVKNTGFRFAMMTTFIVLFLSLIYVYLMHIGWMPEGLIIYTALGVLNLTPITSAIAVKLSRKKAIKKYLEKSKKMKQEKREKLDENQIFDPIPYEQLFVEEFETPIIDVSEETADQQEVEEVGKEYVFNPELTFKKACEELGIFTKERGVYIDPESARALFSAIASSRFIIFNGENKELLTRFVFLLGKYFEYFAVIEDFKDIHEGGDDIIQSSASCYPEGITSTAKAILSERDVENSIRIMSLVQAQSEFVKPCYSQVFKYIDQPNRSTKLNLRTTNGDFNCEIPENVWFVVVLEENQKTIDIPKYMLEAGVEVNLVLREVEIAKPVVSPVEEAQAQTEEQGEQTEEIAEQQEQVVAPNNTPVSTVTYYQLNKMIEIALRDNMLDENLWKRVDKLEDSVSEVDATYHMSSKLWQRLEKYASVYLCAGGEPEEALDSVVANHVVNTMVGSIANAKGKTSEKFVNTIENIFGEGHVPHTVRKVKATGLKI